MQLIVDESFEGFFASVGVAVAGCTILVSFGKFLTNNYLFYIILFSFLVMACLVVHEKYRIRCRNIHPSGRFFQR